MHRSPNRQNAEPVKAIDFNGAAIIDEQGREIPITETMVQQALHIALSGKQERPHLTVVHRKLQGV